jgi:hypothetical protein
MNGEVGLGRVNVEEAFSAYEQTLLRLAFVLVGPRGDAEDVREGPTGNRIALLTASALSHPRHRLTRAVAASRPR